MSDPSESEAGPTPPNKGAGGGRRPSACSRFDVPSTADHILAGAMEKLAESIVSGDGVANAAIREAGQRITVLAHEIKLLRDQLKIADKALEENISTFIDLREERDDARRLAVEARDLLDREGYAVNPLPWESSENK